MAMHCSYVALQGRYYYGRTVCAHNVHGPVTYTVNWPSTVNVRTANTPQWTQSSLVSSMPTSTFAQLVAGDYPLLLTELLLSVTCSSRCRALCYGPQTIVYPNHTLTLGNNMVSHARSVFATSILSKLKHELVAQQQLHAAAAAAGSVA